MNRTKIEEIFKKYTDAYDPADTKVRLKIEHTYRVAELCDQIARSLELSEEDIDFAWLSGMLHDIGRFEQLRRYHTFQDKVSVNHAALSADILFREALTEDAARNVGWKSDAPRTDALLTGVDDKKNALAESGKTDQESMTTLIDCFVDRAEIDGEMMERVIRYHNAFKLPETQPERERMFCDILRDADKIDILKVNCDIPRTEIYDLPEEEFRTSSITPEVYEDIMGSGNVDRKHSRTGIDFILGHISFVYGLVYPESFKLVQKQGYLAQLLNFQSVNPDTAA